MHNRLRQQQQPQRPEQRKLRAAPAAAAISGRYCRWNGCVGRRLVLARHSTTGWAAGGLPAAMQRRRFADGDSSSEQHCAFVVAASILYTGASEHAGTVYDTNMQLHVSKLLRAVCGIWILVMRRAAAFHRGGQARVSILNKSCLSSVGDSFLTPLCMHVLPGQIIWSAIGGADFTVVEVKITVFCALNRCGRPT